MSGVDAPVLLSRRAALATGGGLLLAVALPARAGQSSAGAGALPPRHRRVAAFLDIRPDGAILLRSPFVEGGQGIDTGIVQVVAEELDAEPASFRVECAPPGDDYLLLDLGRPARITGGSLSMRGSFAHFRALGAAARHMLREAAAAEWGVAIAEISTGAGAALHVPTGRRLPFGALAGRAAALPVPDAVALKDPAAFRLIGTDHPRLEARAKSTGATRYGIDLSVEGMLHAAVRHAPRAGMEPGAISNEAAVRAMPGVHGIHRLPGAVAVTAGRWWQASRAVDALEPDWTETEAAVPVGFSAAARLEELRAAARRPGAAAGSAGDVEAALRDAVQVVEAAYDAPFLAHAQLEPPSAIARFGPDGALELWVPNQAPEMFRALAARMAGLLPEQVTVHSPPLGGFFGRHFAYAGAMPMPQAIALARETGRPVKVLWSREEEFARDACRPLSHARLRAGLDSQGNLVALDVQTAGEGPIGRNFGLRGPVDTSVTEGIAGEPYRIPHRRVGFVHTPLPAGVAVGFWRSVGHSANNFFLECFLDEVSEAAGRDPFMFRQALLQHSPRHLALLNALADLAGRPWRIGSFELSGGARRARGLAMASSFGSEAATLAEVSLRAGEVVVHELWIAFDPGRVVNPRLVRQQVEGAAAMGLSAALFEEVRFEGGAPVPRNFDSYPVLRRDAMPRVQVVLVESGAPMGGVGEPGLPAVAPAVCNALAALTGERVRSLPLARRRWGTA